MSLSTPPVRVDADTIARARDTTQRVASAFDEVRRQVLQLRSGAPAWAGDPLLANAVLALLDDVDAAGRRGQADAADLAASLVTAATGYREAEGAATYPG